MAFNRDVIRSTSMSNTSANHDIYYTHARDEPTSKIPIICKTSTQRLQIISHGLTDKAGTEDVYLNSRVHMTL